MRIGIDISTVLNHGVDIGSGRYIINLIKNLLQIDKKNIYILTGRYATSKYLPVVTDLKTKYSSSKLKIKIFKTSQKKLAIWDRLRFPPIELLGFRADIFHCPDFIIPPTLNKNIVLTIHDLAFIRFPQFNFDWFIKKYTKEVKRNTATAKKILADSRSTKNDIVKLLKINPDKIKVVHLAADNIFKKHPAGEIDKKILTKYNIDKRYILSVGTIEPRKNYPILIKAFNILKRQNEKFNLKLVIAGRTGWKSEPTYRERDLSPCRKDILFLGRVSDEDLVQIYNQAEFFVYPTIFEGFGLPLLEAMSCGLSVIATNTSSIPEVTSDAGILVNPDDVKALSEKIETLASNEELKNRLSKKSIEQAKKFSWLKTAEDTLNSYKSVISN